MLCDSSAADLSEKGVAMKMRICLSVFVCLWMLTLAGCTGGKRSEIKEYLAMEEKVQNGEFKIYYLDKDGVSLKHLSKKVEASEQDAVIQELIHELQNPPASEEVISPTKDDVELREYQIHGNVLNFYFGEAFSEMDYSRQILCLGAYAKTLTQIENIDFVDFFVGDVELMDQNAKPIGPVEADTFIDGVSDVNAYNKAEITLYFSDSNGEKLVPETREVFYNINVPLETVVLDELLLGPKTQGLLRTLPSGTKLITTSMVDGICYINLSRDFLEPMAGQKETLAIYSIVNSLTELKEVQKVQISVEGLKNRMYRDLISLDTFFEREGE